MKENAERKKCWNTGGEFWGCDSCVCLNELHLDTLYHMYATICPNPNPLIHSHNKGRTVSLNRNYLQFSSLLKNTSQEEPGIELPTLQLLEDLLYLLSFAQPLSVCVCVCVLENVKLLYCNFLLHCLHSISWCLQECMRTRNSCYKKRQRKRAGLYSRTI